MHRALTLNHEAQTTNHKPPGQQKDMGLMRYANKFAQAGIASLAIDYRGFGASDGMPRSVPSFAEMLGTGIKV